MSSTEATLAGLERDVRWIREKLESLEKLEAVLSGNGRLGVVAKVNLLWRGSVGLIGLVVAGFIGAGIYSLFS